MTHEKIIKELITERKENNFAISVKSIPVILNEGSLGNPHIYVGIAPATSFSKDKRETYVITYGRYLNCEMICYETYKKDKDYFFTKNKNIAVTYLKNILNNIKK